MGAADSAVARVEERSAIVDAAMVAASMGRDGGGTTGGVLGLGVGAGANVTWGLVRRAGVLVDVVGPLLRRAERRLRIAPGRELSDTGGYHPLQQRAAEGLSRPWSAIERRRGEMSERR